MTHIFTAIVLCFIVCVNETGAQTAGGGSADPIVSTKKKTPTKTRQKAPTKAKVKTATPTKSKTSIPVRNTPTATHKNAVYYFDYALYNCGESDLDCKLENFTKAINLNPQLPAAYFNRGLIHFRKKFYNSAIADYTKVIKLDEQNAAVAYNNRGWTYCQMGLYDKALADAERSLELRPDSPDALDTRGNAYLGQGEYGLALEDFDRAIRLDPSNPEMYRSRAALYRKTGKITLAEADEKKVAELGGKR